MCDDSLGEIQEGAEEDSRRQSWYIVTSSGEHRSVEISRAPITSEGGDRIGAVFVFRDVTDERKVEQELQRADKLDSLGVLAGGIAHDFNNLLTAIKGYTELLLRRTSLSSMVTR